MKNTNRLNEAECALNEGHLRGNFPDTASAVATIPSQSLAEPVSLSLVLPKTLTDALQTLSQQEGVTPFMSLLAAFHILLQRYTGQDDLVVGLSIANRTQKEVEGLIGCFANTLALRSNLAGNPYFRELLVRVREASLEAYAHTDLLCEQLVEDLQPQQNQNRLL